MLSSPRRLGRENSNALTARCALHVVANDDPYAEIEAELRAAFAECAQIRVELAAAERRILAARDDYARAQGLLVKPCLKLLQTRYGPQLESAQ